MISRLILGCALLACALPAAASDRATIHALVAQHVKPTGFRRPWYIGSSSARAAITPGVKPGQRGPDANSLWDGASHGLQRPRSGLLDANTNLAYAVPYLANAYKVAGGNPDRAVSLYSGG